MRLTLEQVGWILRIIHQQISSSADVCLFGSRLDDGAKGGDVDLLIGTNTEISLSERGKLKMDLEAKLGLPVDLVVQTRGVAPSPFQRIAKSRSIPLKTRNQ